jgi:DNA-directed RNA polymerase specialized sigma24 family protein
MAVPTDLELVQRALQGEEEAFALLFGRYEEILGAQARRWLPHRLDRRLSVSDLLQETRIIACRRIGELGTGKRDAGREVPHGRRADTSQFPGKVPTPSALAMERERRDALRRIFEDLPEDYREILSLTHQEHLPLAVAAERMGRSREAVKKLHARALALFGRLLSERWKDDDGSDGTGL